MQHLREQSLTALRVRLRVCVTLTGYHDAAARAALVKPCQLLYSTLRPTSAFLHNVHQHIRVPYLLMTDTADEPITAYHGVKMLLHSATLAHWWAVDNEVLDNPKLEGLPLGVMDALELGLKGNPTSVTFHANVSEYLSVLRASQAQAKSGWLMMQMTATHSERRRVRDTFTAAWGDGDVRLTPEQPKMGVRQYLTALGKHRFILSPRGNGLDAHRTWEALLVGAIPIVISSALNPLYEALPVLIVRDWAEVTPTLLRAFHANFTVSDPAGACVWGEREAGGAGDRNVPRQLLSRSCSPLRTRRCPIVPTHQLLIV